MPPYVTGGRGRRRIGTAVSAVAAGGIGGIGVDGESTCASADRSAFCTAVYSGAVLFVATGVCTVPLPLAAIAEALPSGVAVLLATAITGAVTAAKAEGAVPSVATAVPV